MVSPVLYTFTFMSAFNWIIASQTDLCSFHPFIWQLLLKKWTHWQQAQFKPDFTLLSNSTRMTMPLQMTVILFLSFMTFIFDIYKLLVRITSICTIYIYYLYLCYFYFLYLLFFLQHLHLWQSSKVSDTDQSYGCPNTQWLSLVSLFHRTMLCCVTLIPILKLLTKNSYVILFTRLLQQHGGSLIFFKCRASNWLSIMATLLSNFSSKLANFSTE